MTWLQLIGPHRPLLGAIITFCAIAPVVLIWCCLRLGAEADAQIEGRQ